MTTTMIDGVDGVKLAVHETGTGRPVVLLHSWSLNSAIWDAQIAALTAAGFRCIAIDRRGHGQSEQCGPYDADTLADDVAAVMDALDLKDTVLVSHSMGSLETIRMLARQGASRVAKIALVAPITPFLKKTDDNPGGVDPEAVEMMIAMQRADRDGFVHAGAPGFFGAAMTPADLEWALTEWRKSDPEAAIACQKTFSEIDLRADTAALTVPALIIHGDADMSSPLELTALATKALIPHAELKIYPGAPHGLFRSHAGQLSEDLVAFAAQ